jgi:hypothetical protein
MGANNADFHGLTFAHKLLKKNAIQISASHPNYGQIGVLRLGSDGTVGNVIVNAKHLRKGVATGMWNYAVQQGFNPKHSENRTPSGDAWAKSVGGHLPKNKGILNFD